MIESISSVAISPGRRRKFRNAATIRTIARTERTTPAVGQFMRAQTRPRSLRAVTVKGRTSRLRV
ncbi:MAG: hypothetical protein BIFFINMI_02981 [Phycisphaerae bacterium]|nr:hypothetical protein [Phycisphaerae bacterium]